ncbi:hypothetical protein ABZ746_23665 [Streptomyces sp. NPDC020096]
MGACRAFSVALATGCLLAVAPPAVADTIHRGTSGCFAWSWKDGGWTTTTVYYSNRCADRHELDIAWATNSKFRIKVDGNTQGTTWAAASGVESIWDNGPVR